MAKVKLVENVERSPARELPAKVIADRDHKRKALQQARTGIAHAERYVSEAYEQQE